MRRMKRIALIGLLAGCTDPVMKEEPQAPIFAELSRGNSGQTRVSGCWYDSDLH